MAFEGVGSMVLAVAMVAVVAAALTEEVVAEVVVELVATRSQDGHIVKVVAGNCM